MLLHLIGNAKVDIKDIFVSEVTTQYIAFVQNAPDLDMQEASAFIQMAATLLEIKSRSLLPREKEALEEEDPEQALIRQLEEYQKIKELAKDMRDFERTAQLLYQKLPEEYPLPPPEFELVNLTLEGLLHAIDRIKKREMTQEEGEKTEAIRRIHRDEFTVQGAMKTILDSLKQRETVSFFAFFSQQPSKEEVVSFFLGLLELMRLGKIRCLQHTSYEDILLTQKKPKESDEVND